MQACGFICLLHNGHAAGWTSLSSSPYQDIWCYLNIPLDGCERLFDYIFSMTDAYCKDNINIKYVQEGTNTIDQSYAGTNICTVSQCSASRVQAFIKLLQMAPFMSLNQRIKHCGCCNSTSPLITSNTTNYCTNSGILQNTLTNVSTLLLCHILTKLFFLNCMRFEFD